MNAGDASMVSETPAYRGWSSISRLTLRMPDGSLTERHLEDHGAAVAVPLYDPARKTAILVSQPRAPVLYVGESTVLQVVAGGIEDEDALGAARREAMEEAGVAVGEMEFVTRLWTMPSLSTERIDLFLAPYDRANVVGPGGGAEDENEGITVHELPLAALGGMVSAGTLTDAKTLILVQTLMLRRSELFG